jgi:hypothetical protein
MLLTETPELRENHILSEPQKMDIWNFMQGAVYCWVKNRPDEWFAVRDLVGGENSDWGGTPLQILYDMHVEGGKEHDEAVVAAGIDLGWIVKAVLSEDSRTFEATKEYVNCYRWIRKISPLKGSEHA